MDLVAFFDEQLVTMCIGRDPAIRVLDQDQVAVTLELAARVGDRAVLGGPDRGAFGNRDVDAVVAAGLEALNDAAARGPAEFGRGSGVGLLAGDRRDPRSVNVSGRGRIDGALLRRGLGRFWCCRYYKSWINSSAGGLAMVDILSCRRSHCKHANGDEIQ